MAVSARRHGKRQGSEDARALAERLRERREEIEQTLLTRVYAVSDPREVGDPEYALGLRAAVTAALGYALDSLGASESHKPPLPPELPAQARSAARVGVSLDTVLRRYFAGYTLLSDCLVREAETGHADLAGAMRSQAEMFDRLVAAVTEAYGAEAKARKSNAEQRRAEWVRRLLEGELLDTAELGYELDLWHLGVVALGAGAPRALRELAEALDRRLLMVRPGGEAIWAWLGGNRRVSAVELAAHASSMDHPEGVLAVGEPGRGIAGWRLTHRQARTALPVAVRGMTPIVTYSDVALLASVLGDEVLVSSLLDLYLEPLKLERDGGIALRETLRAYFASGRSIASTAAGLGMSRQTVSRRLAIAEQRIGRSLETCAGEMETALRLSDLGYVSTST